MEFKTSVNAPVALFLHSVHAPTIIFALFGYKKYYSLMYVYPFCVYLYYNQYEVSNLK